MSYTVKQLLSLASTFEEISANSLKKTSKFMEEMNEDFGDWLMHVKKLLERRDLSLQDFDEAELYEAFHAGDTPGEAVQSLFSVEDGKDLMKRDVKDDLWDPDQLNATAGKKGKFPFWLKKKKTDSSKDSNSAKDKKVDSKADVRNRGDVCVPAEKAKDKKDHFPVNDEKQARNALAQVNKFTSVPEWYHGSLQSLVSLVAKKVKAKYPSIEVSKEAKKPGPEKKKSSYYDSLLIKFSQTTPKSWGTEEDQAFAKKVQEYLINIRLLPAGSDDGKWGPQSKAALAKVTTLGITDGELNAEAIEKLKTVPVLKSVVEAYLQSKAPAQTVDADFDNKENSTNFNNKLNAMLTYMNQLDAFAKSGQITPKTAKPIIEALNSFNSQFAEMSTLINNALNNESSTPGEKRVANELLPKYTSIYKSINLWIKFMSDPRFNPPKLDSAEEVFPTSKPAPATWGVPAATTPAVAPPATTATMKHFDKLMKKYAQRPDGVTTRNVEDYPKQPAQRPDGVTTRNVEDYPKQPIVNSEGKVDWEAALPASTTPATTFEFPATETSTSKSNSTSNWKFDGDVKGAQTVLKNEGYVGKDSKPIKDDGLLGQNTSFALAEYRKKHPETSTYSDMILIDVINRKTNPTPVPKQNPGVYDPKLGF